MIFPWQPQSSFKGSLIGDGRDSVFILGLFLSFFFLQESRWLVSGPLNVIDATHSALLWMSLQGYCQSFNVWFTLHEEILQEHANKPMCR